MVVREHVPANRPQQSADGVSVVQAVVDGLGELAPVDEDRAVDIPAVVGGYRRADVLAGREIGADAALVSGKLLAAQRNILSAGRVVVRVGVRNVDSRVRVEHSTCRTEAHESVETALAVPALSATHATAAPTTETVGVTNFMRERFFRLGKLVEVTF